MGKPKNWTPGEVVEAAEYLSNISGRFAEHLLRIYDDKGDLVHTVSDQAIVASAAMIETLPVAFPDFEAKAIAEAIIAGVIPAAPPLGDEIQRAFDNAVEGWCDKYLVQGGRERLLTALRTRRYRAEQAKSRKERPPRDAASILSWLYSQDPSAAAEACDVFLDGWRRSQRAGSYRTHEQARRDRDAPRSEKVEPTLDELLAKLAETSQRMVPMRCGNIVRDVRQPSRRRRGRNLSAR